ncbi:MAG: hypothetical protein DMD77_28630 [Candidatus Rokuibacteriota bacterium]|nr:MAG: hypothetical protein DMD77_28630 [Candidatus Rokubacteria bacterium]
MPEVTLVMSVFNGEPFLAAALDSLMAQSVQEFAIIVVNDGSTDGSAQILDEYAGRRGRMQVIHQRNSGVAEAVNRACDLVKTPYIARMDADDISLPDRLARQLGFLRRRPQVALLGGGAEFINARGAMMFKVRCSPSGAIGAHSRWPRTTIYGSGSPNGTNWRISPRCSCAIACTADRCPPRGCRSRLGRPWALVCPPDSDSRGSTIHSTPWNR